MHFADSRDRGLHDLERSSCLLIAVADSKTSVFDEFRDFCCGSCGPLRKRPDLGRLDCEASTGRTGSGCFDRRIERKNVCLKSDVVDGLRDITDTVRGLVYRFHRASQLVCDPWSVAVTASADARDAPTAASVVLRATAVICSRELAVSAKLAAWL